MKKFFQKVICVAFAAAMLQSAAVLASAEESKEIQLSVPIRIEGIDGNIYYETVNVSDSDGEITAADALIFADKESSEIEIKGADSGYITEINGTAAGKFGGYDGWYYCVNNETPSVGVNEFTLKEGDSLTVYYGGFPCQIPFFDTSRLECDKIIVFKSNDEEYDENWNATKVVNFVTDADVTVNGEAYTTNEKGEITLADNTPEGELSVQINKKDSSGAPCVLRFAPDQTISYKTENSGSDKETDTDVNSDVQTDTEKDTDKDTETDTEKDSEKDTDTHSDSDSSSQSSSSSSVSTSAATGTVRTTTAAATTATTTTAAAATASAASSDSTPAATGSRRTTFTLIVFGAAALVVLLMVVIGKFKSKKD